MRCVELAWRCRQWQLQLRLHLASGERDSSDVVSCLQDERQTDIRANAAHGEGRCRRGVEAWIGDSSCAVYMRLRESRRRVMSLLKERQRKATERLTARTKHQKNLLLYGVDARQSASEATTVITGRGCEAIQDQDQCKIKTWRGTMKFACSGQQTCGMASSWRVLDMRHLLLLLLLLLLRMMSPLPLASLALTGPGPSILRCSTIVLTATVACSQKSESVWVRWVRVAE